MTTADISGETSIPLYTPDLSVKMSLEDVVKYYGNQERVRTEETTPKNKASVRVHVRIAPDELASSISLVAKQMSRVHVGTTQGILTKCMARHLLFWYQEVLNLDNLADEYDLVFGEAKKGHTVIRKQLESKNFQFYVAPEKVEVQWEVPDFVMGKLNDWCKPLGAIVRQLLVEGMCWSLTTLAHKEWDKENIDRHFLPEVNHTMKMVKFRKIDLDGFTRKLEVDR